MINTGNSMLLFYNGDAEEVKTSREVRGISPRAFYGTKAKLVRISEGVTSISEEAFAGTKGISVILPETVDYIELSAFDKHAKVLCHKGSYAENWCHESGLKQLEDEIA